MKPTIGHKIKISINSSKNKLTDKEFKKKIKINNKINMGKKERI